MPALLGYGEDKAALEKWQKWFCQQEIHMDKADVAVLDPPRTGCDERLLEALAESCACEDSICILRSGYNGEGYIKAD